MHDHGSLPPLLFISHRHADKAIADVINKFVTMQSGGRVAVFQSSSPWANAPRIGGNLNAQLIDTLWQASALILVYTDADKDWSYCMWEAGVALHPQGSDTKIIVFQCAGSRPFVFADCVAVNARNLVDVQKFANEFLTARDFLPRLNEGVTMFAPNGHEVASAAVDFFHDLAAVLPHEEEPTVEWPTYPFLQFDLNFAHANTLSNLAVEHRTQLIQQHCVIADADKYCEQLFGVPSFLPGTTFKQLAESWKAKHPESRSKWVEALSVQLLAGAMWEFPPAICEFMEGFGNSVSYAPVLTRVRKIPARRCIQFDIYFDRVDIPIGNGGISPESRHRKHRRLAA